ncbi:MAG: cytosine permease [Alphaproteobacteria bacterium]|nr:MAG: cytosine permease [Alphaproteobacteria bacterium]
MSESKIEGYSDRRLPDRLTVHGSRVGLIVASFAISLPSFLNGAQISLAVGLYKAILVSILAGIILCIGACLTAIISVRSRLTTYALVQRSFGVKGAILVNVVLAIIHFGWFGVNISFFGNALVTATSEIYGFQGSFTLFVILGSILISVSTIFGFKTLDKLAIVAVPLLAIVLIGVCIMAIREKGIVIDAPPNPIDPMTFGIALSSLVGGNLLTVVAMPDLSRYSRTSKQAVGAMIISFPISITLMGLAAAIPALAMGSTDIMKLIITFGFGLPALAMLVLSTWTINSLNLYSASLSLSATFPKFRSWMFTLIGGAIGGAMALMGIIDSFIPFLIILGVIIPPIAAIYVIDGFIMFRASDADKKMVRNLGVRWRAVGLWLFAVSIAMITTYTDFELTTVPALDATLIAAIVYLAMLRFFPEESILMRTGD